MTGLRTLGEKRTQETLETIWAFSSIPFPDYSPLGVAILLDIVLALSKSIPELDSPVARTRDNLTVISTEADRENIGSVADESTRCETSVEVPETQSVVPRRRKGELAVRRDDNIGNKVVVAMKNSFWVSIGVIIAG